VSIPHQIPNVNSFTNTKHARPTPTQIPRRGKSGRPAQTTALALQPANKFHYATPTQILRRTSQDGATPTAQPQPAAPHPQLAPTQFAASGILDPAPQIVNATPSPTAATKPHRTAPTQIAPAAKALSGPAQISSTTTQSRAPKRQPATPPPTPTAATKPHRTAPTQIAPAAKALSGPAPVSSTTTHLLANTKRAALAGNINSTQSRPAAKQPTLTQISIAGKPGRPAQTQSANPKSATASDIPRPHIKTPPSDTSLQPMTNFLTRQHHTAILLLAALLLAATPAAHAQGDTVKVTTRAIDKVRKLPGEFAPFQSVDLHARLAGYIDEITVDVGSAVRKGQRLATLSAPEMDAQIAEAKARVELAGAQKAEADAKLLAAQATRDRLKQAAQTPGAIAGNELVLAEKAVDAALGVTRSVERGVEAAQASVRTIEKLKEYLVLNAPFDGVITERYLHPGALAGPSTGPLVRLQQNARLRLIVPVPETELAGIVPGARVPFTVPAHPSETFTGAIARISRTVDPKTRTMPIELDVANPQGRLAPGMYPEVQWPVRSGRQAMLVPPTSIVTTTERTFVIRIESGRTVYVPVRKGPVAADLVEVLGALKDGDTIIRRANDEIREGSSWPPAR
jgi:membrane fusion protein, multidrug efflux system